MKKNLVIVSIIMITILATFFWVDRKEQPGENGTVLELLQPPFVSQAQAGTSEIGAYLDQEAGISAWYKGTTLNLTNIKAAACVTIEINTPDYIVCSVRISNYPDQFYPHVYVHKDGWILAYYFHADPAGKMLDVYAQTLNTTILKTAVITVASAGGSAFTDVSYYDFRFPNATNMLLVAEDDVNGIYFTIEMPYSYIYHERSWAFYEYYNNPSFTLNAVNFIETGVYKVRPYAYGFLSAAQLAAGVTNTFTVDGYYTGYGAIIITYEVP